jgi:radical SAM protein with 4Fe4S-binding SPASM domain
MPSLARKLGRALSQATFDEDYYRLAHPDVDRAIRSGGLESAYQHYLIHGRRERRTIHRNILPGAVPRYIGLVKPAEDFVSGVKIIIRKYTPGLYRFRLFRLSPLGLEKVVDLEIDGEAELNNGVGWLMWSPIEHAKGQIFVARMTRPDGEGNADLAVDFLPTDDFVYSNPEAPSQTPPLVLMSPLTQCNLNCIHCISRPTRVKARELSPEIWRTFEDLAAQHRIHHIASDYSGDIFYAQGRKTPWLDRLIALNVELRFDTHANDLTPEIVDKVLGSRLRQINFSIDSFDPDDYPNIRKGARPLPEVLANVAMFMAKRNEKRPDIAASLSLVAMRRNVSSFVRAVEFAHQHGISFVQVSHLMVFTEDMLEQSALLDLKAYREAHAAASARAKELGVDFQAPPPLTKSKPRKGHEPCTFPWAGVVVTGDGNVNACCMPGSQIGNLNEESLEEIWNGRRFRDFRALVNTPDAPKPCDSCGFFRYENSLDSYVPGLSPPLREAFFARVAAQF